MYGVREAEYTQVAGIHLMVCFIAQCLLKDFITLTLGGGGFQPPVHESPPRPYNTQQDIGEAVGLFVDVSKLT